MDPGCKGDREHYQANSGLDLSWDVNQHGVDNDYCGDDSLDDSRDDILIILIWRLELRLEILRFRE